MDNRRWHIREQPQQCPKQGHAMSPLWLLDAPFLPGFFFVVLVLVVFRPPRAAFPSVVELLIQPFTPQIPPHSVSLWFRVCLQSYIGKFYFLKACKPFACSYENIYLETAFPLCLILMLSNFMEVYM